MSRIGGVSCCVASARIALAGPPRAGHRSPSAAARAPSSSGSRTTSSARSREFSLEEQKPAVFQKSPNGPEVGASGPLNRNEEGVLQEQAEALMARPSELTGKTFPRTGLGRGASPIVQPAPSAERGRAKRQCKRSRLSLAFRDQVSGRSVHPVMRHLRRDPSALAPVAAGADL